MRKGEDRSGSVLCGSHIRRLLESERPLVEEMVSPELQTQENGIELTVKAVHRWVGEGSIALSNEQRRLADCNPIDFGSDGWAFLEQGSYKIVYNEIVNLPKNVIAVGRPRSSLLRSGATIASAVWDAGYSGRGEGLLIVSNPHGLRLRKDARVLQLLFLSLSETVTRGYEGRYQRENV
jgi:dUTP pyrophosphatase